MTPRIVKDAKRFYKEYRHHLYYHAHFSYVKQYEANLPLDDCVLIQSYDGTSISGNPYYIMKELCANEAYNHLKVFVVAAHKSKNAIASMLEKKGLENRVTVVTIHTDEYCHLLVTAKFLVNNSTFPPYFIKREGQIYLNTWHGTPLKGLGKKILDSPMEIGNTQRNFLMSDYLLCPNELTMRCFRDDYMLGQYYQGTYLLTGYPRNEIFFDKEAAASVREELGLEGKNVVVYMPTWRGNLKNKRKEYEYVHVMHTLYQLDCSLCDDTVMFVKLHSIAGKQIPFSEFTKIKPFPDGFETYEFLNAADCLVSDYSSVFFDFANSGKKIILYGYDAEDYFSNKESYFDYNELPFVLVDTPDALLKEIEDYGKYEEYAAFAEPLNRYDSPMASAKVCRRVFLQEAVDDIVEIPGKQFHNGKKTVLVFTGSLARNGITSALKSLLKNADFDGWNVLLTFDSSGVRGQAEVVNFLSSDFDYIPIQGRVLYSIGDAIKKALHLKYSVPGFKAAVDRIYQRELQRMYPGIAFDALIHYSGYEQRFLNVIGSFGGRRIVYVHNDMAKEKKEKGNFNFKALSRAYKNAHAVVGVRESARDELLTFLPSLDPESIFVAHNIVNVDAILQGAKKELQFDVDTTSNFVESDIREILQDPSKKVITNIGRFSAEKGQERLIDAFLSVCKNNDEVYLMIIGGYGLLYDDIREKVESSGCKRIILVRDISNPYPILSQSYALFLSSLYEGLPVTIFEAMTLGVPVISTSIPGPDSLLAEGRGVLVEDSLEGIEQGMKRILFGDVFPENVFDIAKFNEDAIREFSVVLNG